MRKKQSRIRRYVLPALLSAILVPFVAAALFLAPPSFSRAIPQAGATLKLVLGEEGEGFCSAVHLGKGIILTAWHCTNNGDITVETDMGAQAPAEVLWATQAYDVAMLQAEKMPPTGSARLSCKLPRKGDKIVVEGIPMDLGFLRVEGEVVSGLITGVMQVEQDLWIWQERMIVNATIAPGNSGGPMYDVNGRVAGIVVGNIGRQPSLGIAVPSSTICKLTGRT